MTIVDFGAFGGLAKWPPNQSFSIGAALPRTAVMVHRTGVQQTLKRCATANRGFVPLS